MRSGGDRVSSLPIRYARSRGAHIAHASLGAGPPDVLLLLEWIGHFEVQYGEPHHREFIDRLADVARVILVDKRGTGLSDPVTGPELPSFDEWLDDLIAVLDEVSSQRCVVIALGGSGPMALAFAATHPERTDGLVLINAFARLARAPDHPWGMPEHVHARTVAEAEAGWGDGVHLASAISPAVVGDPEWEEFWRRLQRSAASPGTAAQLYRMSVQADARHVLPSIRMPTLVIHSDGDPYVRVEHGRDLAARIGDAAYLELSSDAHTPWVEDTDEVVDAIVGFIGSEPSGPRTNRTLSTVLFADIVGSTHTLSQVGDAAWATTLERYRAAAVRQVSRFDGALVNWLGDGLVATFDRPSAAATAAAALHLVAQRNGLDLRIGLHTGEIEITGDDIAGLAVHLAARLCDAASGGQTLATSTVRDLSLGAPIRFDDRGSRTFRGVPGQWTVFAVHTS